MKAFIKAALAKTPYRIMRRARGNRFSAIDDALVSMKSRGYNPKVVIDGGANVGEFSRFALRLFPDAKVHAIEPQPGCQPYLQSVKADFLGRVEVHPVALGSVEQDGTELLLVSEPDGTSTGAHVAPNTLSDCSTLNVPCRSFDSLFADTLEPSFRTLLKLDLQGYEMRALRGAQNSLRCVEAILCEVSFFAQAYEPTIASLISYLDEQQFDFYDIAALSARARDDRPQQGDFVFVRRSSPLLSDKAWG